MMIRRLTVPTFSAAIAIASCSPVGPSEMSSRRQSSGNSPTAVTAITTTKLTRNVTWPEARLAAETSWLGTTGHLLTVTSQAELDFVQANLSHRSNLWLGGFQDLSAPDYSEPAGGCAGSPMSRFNSLRGPPRP